MRGDTFVRLDVIELDGLEPRIRETAVTEAGPLFGPGTSARPLFGADRDDVIDRITAFVTTLFDVGGGRDRFEPFLSSRPVCRIFVSAERVIPLIDDTRCAAVLLESASISSWYALEGMTRFNPYASLYPLFSSAYASLSDEARVLAMQRANDVLLDELEIAGMLDPAHAIRIQEELGRPGAAFITELTVESGASDLVDFFPLPAGTFYGPVPGIPILVFLTWEDGDLRVAGVLLTGG